MLGAEADVGNEGDAEKFNANEVGGVRGGADLGGADIGAVGFNTG